MLDGSRLDVLFPTVQLDMGFGCKGAEGDSALCT